MRIKMLLLVAAVIALLALAACAGKKTDTTQQPPAAGNTGAQINAEAIYKQNCIGCHAADLSGGVGPNLQKVGSRLTAEQIGVKITDGGSGMPAFKQSLDADQINALTQWLADHK
ncbi:c-type cytochrome [Paenibacillus sp. GCM10027626]|uniref:c-type cytochrome n=1 Tax=Paenibacillus sp. GCM10027626 TaxID=3273411 RepID=UPI0036261B13